MTVPFGFSAGDIAMGIKFIAQVVNALKDTGGASSEYRDVLQFLEGLLLTLKHLQKLDTSTTDPSLANAVRALTAAAQKPIQDFVHEIGKYDFAMKEPKKLSGGMKKIEWAVVVAKKVERLRLSIAAQMQPIHLLLESQMLHQLDTLPGRHESLQQSIDGYAAEQNRFNETLIASISTLVEALKPTNGAAKFSVPRSLENHANTVVSSETSFNLPSSSVQELKKLGEQLCVVLFRLLCDVRQLLALLLLATPQILIQIRLLYHSVLKAPSWLLDDNIHFENALGELRSLPFAYFQHLNVFEAFLESDFTNKPGGIQVALHHYQLLTRSGVRITNPSFLRPRARVYMSINIPTHVDDIIPEDRDIGLIHTPDEAGSTDYIRHHAERHVWQYKNCPHCGLQFFALPKISNTQYAKSPPRSIRTRNTDGQKEEQVPASGVQLSKSRMIADKKRTRIFSLASGKLLPFKKMHVFGRGEKERKHDGLVGHSQVERSQLKTTSNVAYEPKIVVEEAVSDDTDDMTFYLQVREPQIRCDDDLYHIRPILSMVTASEQIGLGSSWHQRTKASANSQVLTCQFVDCSREFNGWEDLNLHLYNDHQSFRAMRSEGIGEPSSEKVHLPGTTYRDLSTETESVSLMPRHGGSFNPSLLHV